MVSVFPTTSSIDMRVLQESDPVLKQVLGFWGKRVPTTPGERRPMPMKVQLVLRQWDRLLEQEGLLCRRIWRPEGGEEIFQLLLPAAVQKDIHTVAPRPWPPGRGEDH